MLTRKQFDLLVYLTQQEKACSQRRKHRADDGKGQLLLREGEDAGDVARRLHGDHQERDADHRIDRAHQAKDQFENKAAVFLHMHASRMFRAPQGDGMNKV